MLEQSFIIAFLVLAIHYTFQEGEIFGFVQRWDHYFWFPAVFGCNVCQTPWHGSLIYVLLYGVNWHWPIVVLCAMGINAGINKLSPDKDTVIDPEREAQDIYYK